MLIACSRMYDVNDRAKAAWWSTFSAISELSGIELQPIIHDGPLDHLWMRDDLGCAFMCGYPWAKEGKRHQALAAPIPRADWSEGMPRYVSTYVVMASSDIRTLDDAVGKTIGWSVRHSQSGFNAPRHHLMCLAENKRASLFAHSVGPLETPKGCLTALETGTADVVPIDSLYFDIGQRTDPATFSRYRSIGHTPLSPLPLLIASPSMDTGTADRLRLACQSAHTDPSGRAALDILGIEQLGAVDASEYNRLIRQAEECEAAGVSLPC